MERRPSEASNVSASTGSLSWLVAGLDIRTYCTRVGRTFEGAVTESGSAGVRVLLEKGSEHPPDLRLHYFAYGATIAVRDADCKGLSRVLGSCLDLAWFFVSAPQRTCGVFLASAP